MTGFVLFGGILLVLLATIIWAAIRAGEDTGAALGAAERRDAAVEALRDLELEYRTGKLSDEEYTAVHERLAREALEARNAAASGAEAGRARGPGDGPESSGSCPGCASPLDGDEAFCPACGTALATRG